MSATTKVVAGPGVSAGDIGRGILKATVIAAAAVAISGLCAATFAVGCIAAGAVAGAGTTVTMNAVDGKQTSPTELAVGAAAGGIGSGIGAGLGRGIAGGVAAKSTTALEQGASRVPSARGPGVSNSKDVGTRWFDPAAPKANGIRIDEGIAGSTWPSQQVDHVVVRSGGNILGPDGKAIVGSLRDNPQAHIPLSDWVNWSTWNVP